MAEASLRLDKWLWHARVTRTRTLAQKLIGAGKVRLNRVRITTPSQPVKVGDVLTMVVARKVLVYRVAALGERRSSFTDAQTLYVDLGASSPEPGRAPAQPVPEHIARPDSRERREARAMRGKMP